MKNKGFWSAATGYFLWGLFPLYWKLLSDVPALEILGHRIVWSLIFLLGLLAVQRNWDWLKPAIADRRTILLFFSASALLSVNWGVYIWAVNSGFVVETSLGYFINPLINVVFGMLIFGERLRPAQWMAVGIASLGVILLTVSYGRLPYIALVLAFSFAIYGVLKKKTTLGAIEGLSLETALMFLPAFGFLAFLQVDGTAAFGSSTANTLLLAGAGVSTAVPLLFFAYGAQRVQLTTLGLLQYMAPTLQFLLGVFVFGEAFDDTLQILGFVTIWVALLVYSAESLIKLRRDGSKQAVPSASD